MSTKYVIKFTEAQPSYFTSKGGLVFWKALRYAMEFSDKRTAELIAKNVKGIVKDRSQCHES